MKTILIQFDTDPQPSVFDRVVAVDAGVEQLFSYGGVTPDSVTGLVHGAIFTRGVPDLRQTAIFVGGSDVNSGEKLLEKISRVFFGPMRVSVMMDSNGCNTTAAAAIALVRKHVSLAGTRCVVLGATGPVGLRAAELLAVEKAQVTLVSRTRERAESASAAIRSRLPDAALNTAAAGSPAEFAEVCQGHEVVVAAGAAGVSFLPENSLTNVSGLRVAVDLNAVPPLGITEVGVMDKGTEKSGVICYGALGVGGLKMKVHRKAVSALFEANDHLLETRSIYDLALRVAGIVAP